MFGLAWETISLGSAIFALSYFLHYIAFQRGIHPSSDDFEIDAIPTGAGDPKKVYRSNHVFLNKWFEFGGGFYGLVAFVHFVLIEFEQVKDFVNSWSGIDTFLSQLGIGMLVGFIVDQFMNFVDAIIWPVNYLRHYGVFELAILLGACYFAYCVARRLARTQSTKRKKADN